MTTNNFSMERLTDSVRVGLFLTKDHGVLSGFPTCNSKGPGVLYVTSERDYFSMKNS